MAWNEPGNNKKDPWGSGGGQQPPDLDEVFRKLQDRLNGLFGSGRSRGPKTKGSGGGGYGFGLILLAVLIGLGLYDSVHVVEQAERGVVKRFGAYNRILMPGLNFALPRPIETVTKVNVTLVSSVVDQGRMLTKDENIVSLDFAVQFKIKDAKNYLFEVYDPVETLRQAAESATRQVVGDSTMDYVLTEGRARLGIDSKQLLQALLDRYKTGLEVTDVNMQDIRPPQQVKEAFDDAVKAREDKETSENEAEAYANGIIPRARGRAARITQQAEAYKAKTVAISEGEAQRFDLLRAQYEAAPEVTRRRLYLETMEMVLSGSSKVIVDGDGSNNLLYLPLDKLIEGSSASSSQQPAGGARFGGVDTGTPQQSESGRLRNPRGGR